MSLHKYILIDIELEPEKESIQWIQPRWSWRKFDQEKLQAFLASVSTEDMITSARASEKLAAILEEACNQSMPIGFVSRREKAAYWWNG